jgi:SAM-dependent methyltransferase
LLFERGQPVDTSITWWSDEEHSEPPERHRYEPSGWFYLRRVLPARSVGRDDVFVDFGSGLGRIVYLAARYPFKRVIGVEIAEELNRHAEVYIEHNRSGLACQEIQLITAPAQDFPIPRDMTVAYFANPFMGTVFETVIENIVDSLKEHPRRLRILYSNPTMGDYLLKSGAFRLVKKSKGIRRDRPERWIFVYESVTR